MTKRFFDSIKQAVTDIGEMKVNGEKRKRESRLNIDGMFILMDAMKGGDINGNVEDLKKKYQDYCNEETVK